MAAQDPRLWGTLEAFSQNLEKQEIRKWPRCLALTKADNNSNFKLKTEQK